MPYRLSMHRSQLPRSGVSLGGIGTGGFEIRQDGGFENWSIFNNAPRFAGPEFRYPTKQNLFFKLWVRIENENPRLVLLQIEDSHGAGAIAQAQYIFPWLSGVDAIHSVTSFPFADLDFEVDGLPIKVSMRAWSPFIPGNVKDSALPLVYFDFDIRAEGHRPADVQVLAVLRNCAAYDQPQRLYENTRIHDGRFSAVVLGATQTLPEAATTGTLCLASYSENSTAYMGWEHHHPYYERCLREFPLPEIDDTEGRNSRDKTTGQRRADPRCFATIAAPARLAPWGSDGDTFRHTFALTWHFPNNYAKTNRDIVAGYMEDDNFPGHDASQRGSVRATGIDRENTRLLEGHYYSQFFDSSENVARYAHQKHGRLLAETIAFHRTFFDSSLPSSVLDQINSQLNTLHTSTWLTRTRMFGVLEGLSPERSFAGIATTDVAMYGQIAVSLLFPELDRMTVDLWTKFQQPNGSVVHSVTCNSSHPSPKEVSGKRVDLPAQYAFMSLRTALWSGDRAFLERLWPSVKRALAYILRERDQNRDRLPDMSGVMCSYDNFPMFGVAPYVATQWLAAVSLALFAARRLGDAEFVAEYTPFYESGCATLEQTTWTGSYFQLSSEIQPQDPLAHLGCLSDQILGDGVVRQLGLPPIIDPQKARVAVRSILSMNYKPDQGLRNCQWPGDQFLHEVAESYWVDQANTCWTGVELNFAAQLYSMGLHESAEAVIQNVDDRHRRWGMVWDHQEFGGHYFRPLSALAIPNAVLGLSYDGVTLRITPALPLPVGRWCVLLPGAYGTYFQTSDGGRLEIQSGAVSANVIELPAIGHVTLAGINARYGSTETGGRTVFTRL